MNRKSRVYFVSYNLTQDNIIYSLFGIRAFHTALEFDNREYFFSKVDGKSGVYDIEPGTFASNPTNSNTKSPLCTRKVLGVINRVEFYNVLDYITIKFAKINYSILFNNCNHFTQSFVGILNKNTGIYSSEDNNSNNTLNKLVNTSSYNSFNKKHINTPNIIKTIRISTGDIGNE